MITSCFTRFNTIKFPVLCMDLRTNRFFFSFDTIDSSVFIIETECCNVACTVHIYQISCIKIFATTCTYKDLKFLTPSHYISICFVGSHHHHHRQVSPPPQTKTPLLLAVHPTTYTIRTTLRTSSTWNMIRTDV